MMDEEHDEADEAGEKIFKPKQKANTTVLKTEVTFRLVTSDQAYDQVWEVESRSALQANTTWRQK